MFVRLFARECRQLEAFAFAASPTRGMRELQRDARVRNAPHKGVAGALGFGLKSRQFRRVPPSRSSSTNHKFGSTKVRSSRVHHGLSFAVSLVMVAALSACGTTQKISGESAAQLSAEKLAERMSLADKAQKEGRTEEALVELDHAAKVDPASISIEPRA